MFICILPIAFHLVLIAINPQIVKNFSCTKFLIKYNSLQSRRGVVVRAPIDTLVDDRPWQPILKGSTAMKKTQCFSHKPTGHQILPGVYGELQLFYLPIEQ